MLAKVRSCYSRSWFADAPQILVVTGDRGAAWTRTGDGYNAMETDLTIAMDHLILAATAEGVGTCWIAAFDPQVLRAALALKENETVFAITPLGYPRPDWQKKEAKERKPLAEIVRYV